jgi:cytidine deaminase
MKTDTAENTLIKSAFRVLKNSYSPHSGFKVGAALLTRSGNVYTGTNVEFDAFSLTVCAERAALFNAVSNGDKNIVKLAIATASADFKFPCGLCRQALIEFNPELEILLVNRNKVVKRLMLKQLLPEHFKL